MRKFSENFNYDMKSQSNVTLDSKDPNKILENICKRFLIVSFILNISQVPNSISVNMYDVCMYVSVRECVHTHSVFVVTQWMMEMFQVTLLIEVWTNENQ